MTSLDVEPITPTGSTLALGAWVELHDEVCRGGRRHYQLLVNHRTNLVIELNEREAQLCDRLERRVPIDFDADAAAFVDELRADGFLDDAQSVANMETAPPRVGSFATTLDARWKGANRIVQRIHDRAGRHCFTPLAVVCQVGLALAGLGALLAEVASHRRLVLRVQPAQIPLIIAMSLIALAIHELAHALVVVHHNRRVDAIGARLFLGTPAVYVESVDALLLTRKQRVIQAAAGPWAEWLVVCVAALWLWFSPSGAGATLLYRFVIVNTSCIAMNLLPFAGLDGSWILADALREPDLGRRSRGAVYRLCVNAIAKTPKADDDRPLAVYSTLNSVVAALLIATSAFFWYQLFGNLTDGLVQRGPVGWLVLLVAGFVLGRPLITVALPRVRTAVDTVRSIWSHVTFRMQWKWRIAGIEALAGSVEELASLSEEQLGVLAGYLRKTRVRQRRDIPSDNYVWVRSGHAIALDPSALELVA